MMSEARLPNKMSCSHLFPAQNREIDRDRQRKGTQHGVEIESCELGRESSKQQTKRVDV